MEHEFGAGYTGFSAAIAAVSTALGGEVVRAGVAKIFIDALYERIRRRTGAKLGVYGNAWTTAVDADFNGAVADGLHWLRQPAKDSAMASALWNGVEMVEETNEIAITGGGYRVPVVMIAEETQPAPAGAVTTWSIFLTDIGEKLASGSESGYIRQPNPKVTHVKYEVGAHKSLRRMAETFFGVTFTEAVGEIA